MLAVLYLGLVRFLNAVDVDVEEEEEEFVGWG